MRTSLLSVVTLLALATVVVIVLLRSLGPPESGGPMGAGSSPGASERASASDAEITGTITVAGDLTARIQESAVLFIIAHKAAGPPFAVRRIVSPRFPFAYRLGPEDVMMAGSPFDGEVRVSARLSRTGTAGPAQSGDLEGEHPAPVRVGARDVDIVISRVR